MGRGGAESKLDCLSLAPAPGLQGRKVCSCKVSFLTQCLVHSKPHESVNSPSPHVLDGFLGGWGLFAIRDHTSIFAECKMKPSLALYLLRLGSRYLTCVSQCHCLLNGNIGGTIVAGLLGG